MKISRFDFLFIIILAAVFSFTGCNQHGDTLASIVVTPDNQNMVNGTTRQFTATGTFTNGMVITWTQVVAWSSSDTTVATVNNTAGSNGIVTSVGFGTTTITAYDAANNVSASATLTVTNPGSISIWPANPYMAVGTTYQLSAIALFSGASVTQLISQFATWISNDPSIATIANTPGATGNAVVTAGAVPGTSIIQATDPISGATGTTTLTVKSTSLASIAIDQINPIISMSTTTLQQFTAAGTFQDGTTTVALPPTWAWSSSNTGVATIDYYTGIAQAVATGTTTITAKDPITSVAGSTVLTLQ